MVRFFKYVKQTCVEYTSLDAEYLTSSAGIGQVCYHEMNNRQRTFQRSIEKDQIKSGLSARKEDAKTLFPEDQVSESDD